MIPIHEFLNRIRWNKNFAHGHFEIGYYVRSEDKIIRIPFEDILFNPKDHFSITIIDSEGGTHMVPYHRIKEVYKNGELVWHRP